MSKIHLIVVGKIKESFTRDWIAEYEKRLKKYCRLDVTELKEARTTSEEAENILNHLRSSSYVISLASTGAQPTSEDFARDLGKRILQGNITFIIGSDKGLEQAVLQKANAQISFGRMTYSHQLVRVILYEQIYRAFTILKGEPYHK